MARHCQNSKIKVVFSNGLIDHIRPEVLEKLIASNKIDQFERTDGWVQVGIDPIRGMGGIPYSDYERRHSEH